jgi:hypothetical protein
MSSTSRSPDDKGASPEEPEKKKAASPGRYSLSDDGESVPSTRIDSTLRMPAVRPEGPKSTATMTAVAAPVAAPPESAPSSSRDPRANAPPPPPSTNALKKPPVPTTSGSAPKANPNGPPSEAKGGAPPAPASQRGGAPAPPKSIQLASVLTAVKAPPAPLPADKDAKKGAPTKTPSKPPPSSAVAAPTKVDAPEAKPPKSVSMPPKPGSEPPLDALLLGELDEGSIAFAFDALVSEDRPSQPGTHEFDLTPVRELFAALAANHMRHVRDFMIDVKWGDVTRDWINICLPPVRTLRKAAERLDLGELGVALEKLGVELDAQNAVGGHLLDAKEKERLLEAYGELVKILPDAFGLDRDKTQREGVIVQALLLQVPDVRKVTIDKLTASGVTSLKELFEANANDLANVSGIPLQLATRIVERVQAYRTEIQSSSPSDARAAEREKLAALADQLKTAHDAYEAAANAWGPDAKSQKRDHFRAREEKWLEISVLLARFGEVERLAGIEKVPFAARITQLSDYLEEARTKYSEG